MYSFSIRFIESRKLFVAKSIKFSSRFKILSQYILTLQRGILKLRKKNLFELIWQKLPSLLFLWPLNQLLNLGLFNINQIFTKFAGLSSQFQKELSGAPTTPNINIFLWMLADIKIIAFSTRAYPRSIFCFNFICVLVFFQKCAMTSVHKDPKISANNHYFANRGHTFVPY